MSERDNHIIEAINAAPLNCGLDGASWLASPANIPFDCDGDITLFEGEGNGIFEIHILYKSTGADAVRAAKTAMGWLFDTHDARMIFGMVPIFQKHVNLIARWSGMKPVGMRETAHGVCDMFVLPKEMWKGR